MLKSAAVFGATGLVGKELLSQLLDHEAYEKVIAVGRRGLQFQHPKLSEFIIPDFSRLPEHAANLKANDYFCCIGTTIKTAGSKEAFRRVDLQIPVYIADIAHKLTVPNLVVISSIGANASSPNFYLRTKGEMENAVVGIYKGNLKFVRPSLLIGDRQEYRFGEKVSTALMNSMGWLFIGGMKKYRGIHVRDVARSMIKATQMPVEKVFLESDDLYT